jgi:hypothetical protein
MRTLPNAGILADLCNVCKEVKYLMMTQWAETYKNDECMLYPYLLFW